MSTEDCYAKNLLARLLFEIKNVHVDMGGNHTYKISANGYKIVTEAKAWLSKYWIKGDIMPAGARKMKKKRLNNANKYPSHTYSSGGSKGGKKGVRGAAIGARNKMRFKDPNYGK